ncbi:uncharacterized protein LOC127875362 isoform X2 [Dreissena polymorpha]|uniref:uncharacterized protein LOC127875362 isoform X2 n=1 Tax=Dreissena polymorpha TaxID=45954 RepID=UPI0022650392|nr:uncharacterized protein LOC127875362 isoform X2 [Dreissena polymorpha]
MSECALYQNGYFKNWLKCCMCLRHLHDGLHDFVHANIQDQHKCLLLMVERTCKLNEKYSCSECTIDNLLPNHDKTKCPQKKSKQVCNCFKIEGKRKCPQNGACGHMLDLTIKRHVLNQPNWKNTDFRQWFENSWEFGKCFTNGTGLFGIGSSICTDASGLISICLNNIEIKQKLSSPDVLAEMIKTRNKLLHSSKLEVGDTELCTVFDLIKGILSDPILAYDVKAKASLEEIEKLRNDTFLITSEHNVAVRKMNLHAIAERKEEIEEELKEIEESHHTDTSDSDDVLSKENDLNKELADLKVVQDKHFASLVAFINQLEENLKDHKKDLEVIQCRMKTHNALLEAVVKTLDEHGKTLKDIGKDVSEVLNQVNLLSTKDHVDINKIPIPYVRVVIQLQNAREKQEETVFSYFVNVGKILNGEDSSNNNNLHTPVVAALTHSLQEITGDSKDIEDIKHECIAIYIQCYSLQSLVALINDYMSGELSAKFRPFVLELQKICGYENVDLEVSIFEKDFVQCLDKFLLKVKRRLGKITYDVIKSAVQDFVSVDSSRGDQSIEMNITGGLEDQGALSESTYDPKSDEECECAESLISDGSDSSGELRSGDDNVDTDDKICLESKLLNTDAHKKGHSLEDECDMQEMYEERKQEELKVKKDMAVNNTEMKFGIGPEGSLYECTDATCNQPVEIPKRSEVITVVNEEPGHSVPQTSGMEQSKQGLRDTHHTLIKQIRAYEHEGKEEAFDCSTSNGKEFPLQYTVIRTQNDNKQTLNKATDDSMQNRSKRVFYQNKDIYKPSNERSLVLNNTNASNDSEVQTVDGLDDISETKMDSEIIQTLHYENINVSRNTCDFKPNNDNNVTLSNKNKNMHADAGDGYHEDEEVEVKEDEDTDSDERDESEENLEKGQKNESDKETDKEGECEISVANLKTSGHFDFPYNEESNVTKTTIFERKNSATYTFNNKMKDIVNPDVMFQRKDCAHITEQERPLESTSVHAKHYDENYCAKTMIDGFPDKLDCYRITLEQDLEQVTSSKIYRTTWDFQIESRMPLKEVSLMECDTAFNISGITDGDKAVPDIPCMCQKWTNNASCDGMCKYSVKVHFNSLCYGKFQQTVKFDFGSEVGKKTMRITMKAIEDIKQIKSEYLTYHGKQWNSDCYDIIPFNPNNLSNAKEDHLDKYSLLSLSTDEYATDVSGESTRENYKLAMHKLLFAEEFDRKQRIAEFDMSTCLTHVSESSVVTNFEGRVQRQDKLFANIQLNDEFKADTLAAQLLFRDTNYVLIRPLTDDTKTKVYEVLILRLQKDSIVVQVTDTFVNDVDFSSKKEIPIEVQMQLNRSNLLNMHKAIDNLDGLHLVLPENFPHLDISETPMSPIDEDLDKCNKNQRDAIRKAAVTGVMEAPPLLIVGPFGTGKTFTIAQATKYIIHKESSARVLICTHSNSEADIYIKEYFHSYVKSGHEEARPLRVVFQHRWAHTVSEDVKPYCLLTNDVPYPHFREPTIDDIKTSRIVVTTMGTADVLTRVVPKGYFTHIFLDEAAQVLETELLVPLSIAGPETRVILAGDYMQMSPVLYSKVCRKNDFQTSLIERLNKSYPKGSVYKIILCENYRSNSAIVDFTSAFYDYPLKAVKNQPRHDELYPLAFFAVRGEEKMLEDDVKSGYYNEDEVQEVVEQVQFLTQYRTKAWTELSENDICVVAPYHLQVMYIRQELRKNRLSSVCVERIDNVQGKEFMVIIISTVRTKAPIDEDDELDLGFLSNIRLCNTAMTRAQSLIITVGDPFALCGFGQCRDFWKCYIEQCNDSRSLIGIEWRRFQFKCEKDTQNRTLPTAFPFLPKQTRSHLDNRRMTVDLQKCESNIKSNEHSTLRITTLHDLIDDYLKQSKQTIEQFNSIADTNTSSLEHDNLVHLQPQQNSLSGPSYQETSTSDLRNQQHPFIALSNQQPLTYSSNQQSTAGFSQHDSSISVENPLPDVTTPIYALPGESLQHSQNSILSQGFSPASRLNQQYTAIPGRQQNATISGPNNTHLQHNTVPSVGFQSGYVPNINSLPSHLNGFGTFGFSQNAVQSISNSLNESQPTSMNYNLRQSQNANNFQPPNNVAFFESQTQGHLLSGAPAYNQMPNQPPYNAFGFSPQYSYLPQQTHNSYGWRPPGYNNIPMENIPRIPYMGSNAIFMNAPHHLLGQSIINVSHGQMPDPTGNSLLRGMNSAPNALSFFPLRFPMQANVRPELLTSGKGPTAQLTVKMPPLPQPIDTSMHTCVSQDTLPEQTSNSHMEKGNANNNILSPSFESLLKESMIPIYISSTSGDQGQCKGLASMESKESATNHCSDGVNIVPNEGIESVTKTKNKTEAFDANNAKVQNVNLCPPEDSSKNASGNEFSPMSMRSRKKSESHIDEKTSNDKLKESPKSCNFHNDMTTTKKTLKDMAVTDKNCDKKIIDDTQNEKHNDTEEQFEPVHMKSYSDALRISPVKIEGKTKVSSEPGNAKIRTKAVQQANSSKASKRQQHSFKTPQKKQSENIERKWNAAQKRRTLSEGTEEHETLTDWTEIGATKKRIATVIAQGQSTRPQGQSSTRFTPESSSIPADQDVMKKSARPTFAQFMQTNDALNPPISRKTKSKYAHNNDFHKLKNPTLGDFLPKSGSNS